MKTILCLGALVCSAAAAAAKAPSADAGFGLLDTEYKRPQVLTDAFFNPFKVQADAGLSKKEGPGVAVEAVIAAIGLRGVSGLVYAAGQPGKFAVIGDQVFSLGDELTFPGGDKGELAPLIPGATVVLREVGRDSLGLDVDAEGDAPRRITFALRNFRRP